MDLLSYQRFVETVTSIQSNELDAFVASMKTVQRESGVNIALLMTAAIGMAAEGGEFAEIPKKVAFQGKPMDEDTIFHMKRELGDILWYWVNACRALNLDPDEVVAENVRKLEKRYPGGEFDSWFSENRKEGDL